MKHSCDVRTTFVQHQKATNHDCIISKSTMTPTESRVFVCVECGAEVPQLVRDYGKGNVRLAICSSCNAVADPYVEYDNVLLFLEVMLLKPQVYRHVLYNLTQPPQLRTILKLFVILVMLDMNVKAYLLDRKRGVVFRDDSVLYRQHLSAQEGEITGLRISQYSLHLILVSLVENVVLVTALFAMIWLDPFHRGWWRFLCHHERSVKQHSASLWFVRYGTAICISSFGKMFALLTVIWEFHWTFVHVIGAIVVCSNALALQLLIGEKPWSWALLLLIAGGLAARFLAQLALYQLGNPTLFYVFV